MNAFQLRLDEWIKVETQTYPILILNNILPYRSQGGPFTVVSGSDSTAFMGFEFAHWKSNEHKNQSNDYFYVKQQLTLLRRERSSLTE